MDQMIRDNVLNYKKYSSFKERAKELKLWMDNHDFNQIGLVRELGRFAADNEELMRKVGLKSFKEGACQAQLSDILRAKPTRKGGLYVDCLELYTERSWRMKEDVREPAWIRFKKQKLVPLLPSMSEQPLSTIVDSGIERGNIWTWVRRYRTIKGAEGGSLIMGNSVAVKRLISEQLASIADSYFEVEVCRTVGSNPPGSIARISRLKQPTLNKHFVLLECNDPPNYRIIGLLIGDIDDQWILKIDGKKLAFAKTEYPRALCVIGWDQEDL